jgi:hypothetical protein
LWRDQGLGAEQSEPWGDLRAAGCRRTRVGFRHRFGPWRLVRFVIGYA